VVTGTWSVSKLEPQPNMDALLAGQPQVQAQQAAVEIARVAIKSARSSLFPTLSVNYSKGTRGETELPKDPFWTFTGTVNYPLFGGGLTSTYYANAAAEHTYEKAKLDLRALRNQTRT